MHRVNSGIRSSHRELRRRLWYHCTDRQLASSSVGVDKKNDISTNKRRGTQRRSKKVERPQFESLFSQVDDIGNKRSEQDRGRNSRQYLKKLTFPLDTKKEDETPRPPKRLDQVASSSASPKSLFELFNIPEPSRTTPGTDAFEDEAYEQYMELLGPVIQGPRMSSRFKTLSETAEGRELLEPVIAWLKARAPSLEYTLPALDAALDSTSDLALDATSTQQSPAVVFAQDIKLQQQKFVEAHQLTPHQYILAGATLATVVSNCARQANAEPVSVIWQKVKEAGLTEQRTLHTLLYLTASTSSGRHGGESILDVLGSPESRDSRRRVALLGREAAVVGVELVDEIAAYHDLLYEPTEQTINVKARLMVAQNKPLQAEQLLEQYADTLDLRLRSFAPILKLYIEQEDVSSALRLFHRMSSLAPVHLDCDTYISLLVCLAERGCFVVGAAPIESATSLGFAASSGPGLFDELATRMAIDITEIPVASAKRLYNAFAAGFKQYALEPVTSFAPLPLASDPAAGNSIIVDRVQINPLNGTCPRTGVKLRLIRLEEEESMKLKESIVQLARTMQVNFQKSLKATERRVGDKCRADDNLKEFFNWLDKRDGQPFTTIVDGANIGYYMQNFEDGRFSYHQIKFVVDHLERLGETPLIIIPFKYSRQYFHVTIGAGGSIGSRKQNLSNEEIAIRDKLVKSGKVFIVQRGFLDDFYWILASLSKQTNSRKGRDLFVQPESADGRWPGGRPVLISNDQMRDHKVGMLEPRLFRRWYSNFIVNYSFAGFVNNKCIDEEINFTPADFYSREIQGNLSENAMAWHFPILETDDEWFCIRIPTNQ